MAVNKKPTNISVDRKYWLFALKIVGNFGLVIALPVIIFVLIGQWLDQKYSARPWCTIGAFALAAVISGKIIYKKTKEYAQQYQNLDKK